jgi:hypothetical protein
VTPSAISGRTELLAIVADPVAQAQSPMLINAALAARDRDAALAPRRWRSTTARR